VTAEHSFDIHAANHGRGSERALASKRVMYAARIRLGHTQIHDPFSDLQKLHDELLADKDTMAIADEYRWIASVYDDAGAAKVANEFREIAKAFSARAACGVSQTPPK
jgi:hypothetical protein